MSSRQVRYWDAASFIAWFKGEAGRKPACEGWLKEAEQGKVLIVTSTMTLVEVVKFDHTDALLAGPDAAAKIEAFFRHSWISLRAVDPDIGEKARGLIWDHGVRVRDAIHIATALRYRIPFLDTYDRLMIDLGPKFPDLVIGHPPQVPEQLSAEPLMAPTGEPHNQDEAEAEFASLKEPVKADV